MNTSQCFHCGNDLIKKDEILFDGKFFVVMDVKRFMKYSVNMTWAVIIIFKQHRVPPRRKVKVNMIF